MTIDAERLASIPLALAGPGAIGDCHAEAIAQLGGRIVALAGPKPDENHEFAERHGIPETYGDLDELLTKSDAAAVIVASPSPLHARQALAVLRSGRHVLCEIPVALSLADAEAVARTADAAGLLAMVCHTLRFWAPFVELRARAERGELRPRHVIARSTMLRQSDVGWTGKRRDWTDNVLWHHGAHAVDAAIWLLGSEQVEARGARGPDWPGSGVQMDVAAALVAPDGGLATVALSYHARIAKSDYLVIAEDQTYEIRDGRLFDANGVVLDSDGTTAVQDAAIRAQDLEFLTAILERRPPRSAVADVLPAMRALQALEDTVSVYRPG